MIGRAALALGLAVAGCGAAPSTATGPIGPALTLSWPALDGGTIDVTRFRGQIVVLHVFTTWSLAAQLELDALGAADARPDVVVIGLALDAEGYLMVAPWRRGSRTEYLIALADDATRAGATALGRVREVPTTVILDRRGRLAQRLEHQLAPAELDAAIARAARQR